MLEDNVLCCRICLEEADRKELIAPCNCRGTSKYVHRECLDKWRYMREDRAFSKCTECLCQYKLIPKHTDSESAKQKRMIMYVFYVTRDFLLAFLATQLCISLLAVISFSLDKGGYVLSHAPYLSQSPLMFYYLFGLFLFFAIVGLLSILRLCTERTAAECSIFECCHRTDCIGCRICCPHVGECPNLCLCCGQCSCGECGSATPCLADVGAECLPALIIILVLLAILGVFISCLAGIAYTSRVTTRHLVILQKKGLVADFIVADLELLARSTDNMDYNEEIRPAKQNNGYSLLNFAEERPQPRHVIEQPREADIEYSGGGSVYAATVTPPNYLQHDLVNSINSNDQQMLRSMGLM